MRRVLGITLLMFCFSYLTIYSQLSITSTDTPFIIDFESSVSGVNSGTFDGSGFDPSPAVGQLDSDAWEILGLSDGDLSFGGTGTSGDYARGSSSGGVSTGGIYAFDIGSGDIILGVQSSGSDFDPGSFILKVVNSTGSDVSTFEITYHINVYNNGGYSSFINFLYSKDNTTYHKVSELDFATTETADISPSWTEITKTIIVSAHLADGESFYLQWQSIENVTGTGSGTRDEFGIDDIVVKARSTDEGIIMTELADHSTPDESYVEIFNSGSIDISIENWVLIERYNANNTDERTITFNSSTQKNTGGSSYLTLSSSEYAVIVRADPASLKTDEGIADGVALFEDSVPPAMTGDERYQLVNAFGDVIDNFGLWTYVDAGSFRFSDGNAYERTGGVSSDGELSASWTETAVGSYDYTPGAANTTALPVELTFFDAEYVNKTVELNWETATEVNNFGFEIQQQVSSFEYQDWEKVGFVEGQGTKNSPTSYSFVDDDLPNADNVSYRLKQIDIDGEYNYSKVVEVDLTSITGVEDDVQYSFVLEQNYPNPFNPATTIKFSLPDLSSNEVVTLKVFNLLGQQVTTLLNETKQSGAYEIEFDATNLPSGIYLYTLSYGNHFQTRKLLLLK